MRAFVAFCLALGAACGGRSAAPAPGGAGTITYEWSGKIRGSFTE